jgi:hypothetical protein
MRTGEDERRVHNTRAAAPGRDPRDRAPIRFRSAWWIAVPSIVALSLVVAVFVTATAWLEPGPPREGPNAAAVPPPREGPNAAAVPPPVDPAENVSPGPAVPAEGKGGIAVFPPPGTEPLRRGLVVPDDFELPQGYVRHYQTTDDGERLPPILMFHPDYRPVGEDGSPIPLPADRVVPPELAPPGFPIAPLVHPADALRETR